MTVDRQESGPSLKILSHDIKRRGQSLRLLPPSCEPKLVVFDIELYTPQNPLDAFVEPSLVELQPWEQHPAGVLEVLKEICKIVWQAKTKLSFDGNDLLGRQTANAIDDGRLVAAHPLFAVQ